MKPVDIIDLMRKFEPLKLTPEETSRVIEIAIYAVVAAGQRKIGERDKLLEELLDIIMQRNTRNLGETPKIRKSIFDD